MRAVPNPRRSARRHGDAGVSLIFVMVFIIVVGMTAAALAGLTVTSLRVSPVYDSRGQGAYEIDGALQVAVNEVRNSTYNFTDGDPECFPDADGATTRKVRLLPTSDGTRTSSTGTIAVTCAPGGATGGMSELVPVACDLVNSPSTCNRPGNAILTLNDTSRTDEPGLQIDNRLLTVGGRVFSNSTIVLNGSLCAINTSMTTVTPPTNSNCAGIYSKVPNWPIIARGRCIENGTNKTTPPTVPPSANQPRIFSVPAAKCNYGSVADVYGNDPNYPQPSTASLTYRRVASCQSGQRTLTLDPGYYDDAAALSSWTSGRCSGNKTVILNPGTYFFDFRNKEMPRGSGNKAMDQGDNIWDISGSNVTVVGGEAPNGSALSGPINASAVPGACRSPLDSPLARGVTLVFGGDSRIEYAGGRVELCGSYNNGAPPVVVYGAVSDSANVAPVTVPAATANPTTPASVTVSPTTSSSSWVTYAPTNLTTMAQNLYDLGGSTPNTARVTITRDPANRNPNNRTATLTMSGLTLPTAVPAGSIVTSAKVTITHKENNVRTMSNGTPLDSIAVTVTPSTGSSTTATLTPKPTTFTADVVDITDGIVTDAHDYGLTGVSLSYAVTAAPPGSSGSTNLVSDVDQVKLEVTYRAPSVRSQNTEVLGSASAETVANTNCMAYANGPYVPGEHDEHDDGSGCALLASTPEGHRDYRSINGTFYVQGTVYARYAAVELILPKQNRQAVRSGLIARSVRINVRQEDERGNDRTGQISIEVPGDSVGLAPVDVYYTAYVCTGAAATCTVDAQQTTLTGSGWTKAGLARVAYQDRAAYTPIASSRQVNVESWQILR